MDINAISDHPLMKQILEDVEKSRQQKAQEQMEAEMEAARFRQEQGQYLRKQYEEVVQEYETARLQLHAVVGKVWQAAQAYSKVTSKLPPTFPSSTFKKIDLPSLTTLKAWDSGFSTTEMAIEAWFANHGKVWK